MGPAAVVSSGTIASWLKETLTLANNRLQEGQPGRQVPLMQPVKEPILGQSWKLVTVLTPPWCNCTTLDNA